MKPQTIRTFLLVLIALFLGAGIGYKLGVQNQTASNQNKQITFINQNPPPGVTTVDFSPFWTVMQKIQTDYYDKSQLDPQKMLDGAISGMVDSIGDPYTMYLPPQKNDNFKQSMAGQFSGIGAELGTNGKQIIVIAPLDGSPAEKAGIKAADVILGVDGKSIEGVDLQSAVDKIRGPKGSQVKLTIQHKGESQAKTITITRNTITVKSVSSWVKKVPQIDNIKVSDHQNDEVAYLRISQFGDNTNQEWQTNVNQILPKIQNNPNFKGVILDLRDNPGGYLTDAQFIASEFIKDGIIVKEQAGDGSVQTLQVNRKGALTDVPLLVLTDKGTASASEIVSGALRDHGRAKLVGDNTFGKGIVQEAEDMGQGAGLHITTAKWLTPNGTWVGDGKNGAGLTPDVKVQLDPKQPTHDTQLEKAVEMLVQ